MKTKKFLAFATALCLAAGYATTIVDLADGATVSASDFNGYNGHSGGTASAVSVADYALRFGKDVTITLDATAAVNGVFTLYANIYATGGGFTIDATGIDVIHWVGGVQTSGKVTVKGAKEIRFGEVRALSSPNGKANLSYFNTDVEFENGEATGLVFTNAVTCAKLPTSCPLSFAAGMRLAVDAYGLLGGGAPTFTLSDYDITLIETKGIAAGEVIVPAGRTLEVRQCYRTAFNKSGTNIGKWTWGGQGGNHVTNNITFEAGSVFYVDGAQGDLYFDGDLSGETAFTANLSSSNPIHFTSTVQLAGTLTISSSTVFDLSGEGPFSFGLVTSSAQHNFTGLEGRVLSISALAANSIIGVGTGIDLRLGSVGNGARVNLLGAGPWTVQGPASGAAANLDGVLAPAATGSITLGGLLKLGDLGTTFSSVTLLEGAVLTGTTFDPSVTISGAGRVMCGGTSWKEKIYFWGDAQQASSIVRLDEHWDLSGSASRSSATAKITSSGADYPLIWEWKDCRGSSASYAIRSLRCSTFSEYDTLSSDPRPTYPFYASNVVVGGSSAGYVSFAGSSAGSRQARLVKRDGSGTSWAPCDQNTEYAILVFGSQQGGGAGLLGSANAKLARIYSKNEAAAANPIFTNMNYTVFLGGQAVEDSTVTGLNGGWQIVSADTDGKAVQGLGFDRCSGDYAAYGTCRGYSNYAEVMLFSEAPTEMERKVAEEYLAAKWGLPCAHSDTREEVSLTLGVSGATASAVVEYAADDIPRAFTVNLDFGSGTVRGARYPILKCQEGCTYTLGNVTGARHASNVALEYDSETGTLYAAIPATGFRMIIQ